MPSGRRCFVGHSPPGCSLLAPCQTNASPGNPLAVWTALLRRSQPAWLLPPRALPDERLRRTPRQETPLPSGRRCFVGHSPPGCSLLAPCQTNASPGNPLAVWTALLRRSQPAWLLPPRALPDERLARKPPCRLDGVASSVTARLAAPSSRLARRTPRQETPLPSGRRCFVGHSPPGCSLLAPCQTNASPGNPLAVWTALLRRSQPAWLLPPRALPDERLARKPLPSGRRCFVGHSPGRAHARPAAAEWGSRGPREAVAWGSGRSPV